MLYPVPGQKRIEPIHVVGRRVGIVVAEKSCYRTGDIADPVRRRRHVSHRVEETPAIPVAATAPALRKGRKPDKRCPPAHAMADQSKAVGIHPALRRQPVRRCFNIQRHLLVGEIVPAVVKADALGQHVIMVRRDRGVSVRG
jgi:hypothetical protein